MFKKVKGVILLIMIALFVYCLLFPAAAQAQTPIDYSSQLIYPYTWYWPLCITSSIYTCRTCYPFITCRTCSTCYFTNCTPWMTCRPIYCPIITRSTCPFFCYQPIYDFNWPELTYGTCFCNMTDMILRIPPDPWLLGGMSPIDYYLLDTTLNSVFYNFGLGPIVPTMTGTEYMPLPDVPPAF